MPLNQPSQAEGDFVLRGDVVYSGDPLTLRAFPDAFLVCRAGKSAGVFTRLPAEYSGLPLEDRRGKLILPGLTDLHIHAPQFGFRALGMDLELLDWLEKRAFPEEAKFSDPSYARLAYGLFTEAVRRGPGTRLCVFATIHPEATMILQDLLEESGLVSLVGKVSMDRNCPASLREEQGTVETWLALSAERKYRNTGPILTPRFIPSCGDDLLRSLGKLARSRDLPVQSHLSENRREIAWVRELCPASAHYAGAYRDFDLFGGGIPTIMAHCVWPEEGELQLIRERGVYVAHCPQSNTNIGSGIAPARRLLNRGIPVGLGSDVAGGIHSSIFRAMGDAIQVSKLRKALAESSAGAPAGTAAGAPIGEDDLRPLGLEEAFWMGSAGGGAFFNTGSFEEGKEFDCLVIDDADLAAPFPLSLRDRLERTVYLSEDRHIQAKYVRGKRIL
ncbi:MAG: amidohydrolase family protein [Treponema sp.]|jgi:guanine deaminase|nr:amidohydrolase family protein [Treponema sp.]